MVTHSYTSLYTVPACILYPVTICWTVSEVFVQVFTSDPTQCSRHLFLWIYYQYLFLCCYDQNAIFQSSFFHTLLGSPNVCQSIYLFLVHLIMHVLCLIFLPCLLMSQACSQQLIFGCHFTDPILHTLGLIQDCDFVINRTLAGKQPLGVGLL